MNRIINKFNWTAVITAVLFSLCFVQCAKDDVNENPTPTTPVDPKARFIGNWMCAEVSHRDPPAGQFQVHILNLSGDSLIMENCYAMGFDKKIKLIVAGDSIKFAPQSQVFVGTLTQTLYGKGKLTNSSTIKMTYVIDDGNSIKDTVDATFTK